ncbi:MAG TPA: efflux RND transporter periplasmic adaptor subunit [Terriglobales bacterium]|jgi:membrane fusion protein, multidrug efflux system|nr:efflux RND transporter periplasmic adaptor subunit [Terriglobales bacterium]
MEQQLLEVDERARQQQHERHRQARRKGYLLAAVLGFIFVVIAVVGISMRLSESRALAKETEEIAVPTVDVVHPSAEPAQSELQLPSTLQAYIEAPIYARTTGYLRRWYKDIGSKVNKGELLADIETPEVDQELMQARAARDQAAAQLKLAQSSAKRWENLQKMDAVSQQETDERSSSYIQGEANLNAADANVRRLEQLESFKHIYAPFSGVITTRNTDVGSLVNAGNGGPTQQLFVIAQIDPIRVYVNVPEVDSPSIHKGVKVDIEVPALVGQHFTGSVVRTADAIDPATRTLNTEIDVPNPKGQLLPGSYAQVHLALKEQVQRLTVPSNALLFRAEGPRAAVVGAGSKVQLRPVAIGRDFGNTVEIISGLESSDAVVVSPSDSLENGQVVRVAQGSKQQ